MKIFLLGDIYANAGPSNVNRALAESADSSLLYISSKNKVYKKFEKIIKAWKADVIVASGVPPLKHQKILKVVNPRAKLVYLMHGNLEYENAINHLHLTPEILEAETDIFKQSDAIVCVSKRYSEWVSQKYPQLSEKITYVNNGLDIIPRAEVEKKPLTIAVGGGNRCIKNNVEVCKAVEKLIQKGLNCRLYIFGRQYPENDDFSAYSFAEIMGQMTPEEYHAKLDEVSLFVIDSEVESFGLVVGDALNCHCSMLLSKNTGAISIMNVTEEDCIQNPHDLEELSSKIQNVLEHPNANRLLQSVDADACSAKQSYQRLKRICEEVMVQ